MAIMLLLLCFVVVKLARSLRLFSYSILPWSSPHRVVEAMAAWQFYYLPIIFIGSVLSSSPNSRGNSGFSSPVNELQPSLAASVAGGTIIAARSYYRGRGPSKLIASNEDDDKVDEEYTTGNDNHNDADDDDDCLVLLFRSPMQNQQLLNVGRNLTTYSVFGSSSSSDNDDDDDHHHHAGLTFLPNGPVNFPFLPAQLRILHAPSGLILAATGFAPDIDHILHVAAGRVLSRSSIFDDGGGTLSSYSRVGTKSVDPHRLLREDLSSLMIDATMSDGGRPWGVQLLVIGQSALSTATAHSSSKLEMYTLDPSGGWRSYCDSSSRSIGTAIGRGAERVRSCLQRQMMDRRTLQSSSSTTDDDDVISFGWKASLDRAMMASMIGLDDQQNDDTNDDENLSNNDDCNNMMRANFGAVVIFGTNSRAIVGTSSGSRCAMINSITIEESYNRCRRKLRLPSN